MNNESRTSPLLAIVIPCYNYGRLLAAAVESVIAQAATDIEILIVDDGSTDDTETVCAALVAKHGERLRVFRKPNGGLSSARNFGIDNSTGDYLIFLDADDELLPNALQTLRECIQRQPQVRMIVGSHVTRYSDGKTREHPAPALPATPEQCVRAYLIEKSIPIASSYTAIHRSVFAHYRYNETLRNAEDIPMFAYILANYPCVSVPVFIASMFRHRESLRHNTTHAKAIGVSLVDEVFAPERMPFQQLRGIYLSMRLQSLFRTFYQAGDYAQALDYYAQAIKNDARSVFRLGYTRKALIAKLSLLFGRRGASKH